MSAAPQQLRPAAHTVYFGGHGTTQALAVLLVDLAVAGVILGVLDWRRSEPSVPADVAAMAAPSEPCHSIPDIPSQMCYL